MFASANNKIIVRIMKIKKPNRKAFLFGSNFVLSIAEFSKGL